MAARGTIIDNPDGTARFETVCPACTLPAAVDRLDPEALKLFVSGRGPMVQDAFPRLSASEREVFMTGMHAECFERVCGPEDDEDDGWAGDYDPAYSHGE